MPKKLTIQALQQEAGRFAAVESSHPNPHYME